MSPLFYYIPNQFTSEILYNEDYHLVFHLKHPFNQHVSILLKQIEHKPDLKYLQKTLKPNIKLHTYLPESKLLSTLFL